MKTKIGIVSGVIGAISAFELGNWILLILSIIGVILSGIVGVWNIVEKIKKAKADGIITEEEKKDILGEVDKIAEDVKDKLMK